MIALFYALFCSLAVAQQSRAWVLHSEGDAATALADVRKALGDGGGRVDLSEQRLMDLLGSNPLIIGGGSVERCVAPPTGAYIPGSDAATIAARRDEVSQLIDETNLDKAILAVRALAKLVPCSRDPLDAALLRSIFFKQGYTASLLAYYNPTRASPYVGEATTSYGLWRQITPDDRLAMDAAASLAEPEGKGLVISLINQRVTSTSLAVMPEVVGLWIDGVSRSSGESLRLSVGQHLVQIRTRPEAPVQSMWVKLDATEPALLVVPALLPDDVLEWVESPSRRGPLTSLLGVLGAGEVYIVTSSRDVWRGEVGRPESWGPVKRIPPPHSALQQVGKVTSFAGLGVAGASAVAMGTSCLVSRRAATPYASEDISGLKCGFDDQATGILVFDSARGAMIAGFALANAGLGLFTVGGQPRLSLAPTPRGALLRVSWGAMPQPRYPL